ncbi:MAG: type III pantothenate kinase [Gammaproteobacteria bacterium]|nr:MAG: type III pantothenate kinase [Gammaproteobacteria bacterium]
MILLLDIGNTRLKWGWLQDGRLAKGGALAHRECGAEWLAGLPALAPAPARIMAANVAGPDLARAIDEWALQGCGRRVEFLQSESAAGGLANAYEHPETLGVDRWLGMIGAWRRAQAPLVCIAAGTAMTVDAVDATGRHLGGWILPGQALMVAALRNGTADIARNEHRAPARVVGSFGTNTAGAVAEGCWQALAAAAGRAVRLVAGPTGLQPRVFVGGGDAEQILARLDLPAEPAPDLVLEGLAVIAGGE